MDAVSLNVQPRNINGKKVKTLRRTGITPIHVYGKGTDSLTLQVETPTLIRTLARVGRTVPLTLNESGHEHFVFVREIQRHPVSEQILHVDFMQVSLTEKMRTMVPLELVGTAPAARMSGVVVQQNIYQVEVEALPMDLPPVLNVDMSLLQTIDQAIHVRDLKIGDNVTIITEGETVIIHSMAARVQVEEAAAAAGEAAAPAAEAEEKKE